MNFYYIWLCFILFRFEFNLQPTGVNTQWNEEEVSKRNAFMPALTNIMAASGAELRCLELPSQSKRCVHPILFIVNCSPQIATRNSTCATTPSCMQHPPSISQNCARSNPKQHLHHHPKLHAAPAINHAKLRPQRHKRRKQHPKHYPQTARLHQHPKLLEFLNPLIRVSQLPFWAWAWQIRLLPAKP